MEKIFKKGDIVEVQSSEFEFYKNNKPTGHYMRGYVEEVKDGFCMVLSFCNGKLFKISNSILKLL